MQFSMDSKMQFPLVDLYLNQGETVFIQRGSMVYHTPNVTLNTQLNANGSGLGRFVKAVGRSMAVSYTHLDVYKRQVLKLFREWFSYWMVI